MSNTYTHTNEDGGAVRVAPTNDFDPSPLAPRALGGGTEHQNERTSYPTTEGWVLTGSEEELAGMQPYPINAAEVAATPERVRAGESQGGATEETDDVTLTDENYPETPMYEVNDENEHQDGGQTTVTVVGRRVAAPTRGYDHAERGVEPLSGGVGSSPRPLGMPSESSENSAGGEANAVDSPNRPNANVTPGGFTHPDTPKPPGAGGEEGYEGDRRYLQGGGRSEGPARYND